MYSCIRTAPFGQYIYDSKEQTADCIVQMSRKCNGQVTVESVNPKPISTLSFCKSCHSSVVSDRGHLPGLLWQGDLRKGKGNFKRKGDMSSAKRPKISFLGRVWRMTKVTRGWPLPSTWFFKLLWWLSMKTTCFLSCSDLHTVCWWWPCITWYLLESHAQYTH